MTDQKTPEESGPNASLIASLRQGWCPLCDEGPFRMVAQHINRVHRMNRREFSDLVGISYSVSICSEATSEIKREQADVNQVAGKPRRQQQVEVSEYQRRQLRTRWLGIGSDHNSRLSAASSGRWSAVARIVEAGIDLELVAMALGQRPRQVRDELSRRGLQPHAAS